MCCELGFGAQPAAVAREQLRVPSDKENRGWREQGVRRNKNSGPGMQLCSFQQPHLQQPHAWLGKMQKQRLMRNQGQRIHPGVAVDVGAASSVGLGDLGWCSCHILEISGEWERGGRQGSLIPSGFHGQGPVPIEQVAPSSIQPGISLSPKHSRALGQDQEL